MIFLLVELHALPRVVVLTKNSLRPLARLLDSVTRSEPLVQRIDLHICCDVPLHDDIYATEVQTYVKQVRWKRGMYSFAIAPRPRGLATQWLHCANGTNAYERFVIIEDNIEISKYALSWIDSAYTAYANDSSVIGFSLQRQTNCFHSDCSDRNLSIPWTVREYKYLLIGTWGFAPVPAKWTEFVRWYDRMAANQSYVPFVDNLVPSRWYQTAKETKREQSMWSMWIIDYSNRYKMYIVYYNHPTSLSLAAHWIERGEHLKEPNQKRDFNLLDYSIEPIDRTTTPVINWNGKIVAPSLDQQTTTIVNTVGEIASRGTIPLLTFVDGGFRNMSRHFFCNLHNVAPELFSSIVVAVGDAATYSDMLLLRNQFGRFTVLPFAYATTNLSQLLFGTRPYFELMLARTRLVASIAARLVPFFLFECDVTVRENFVNVFAEKAVTTNADLVGIQDNMNEKRKYPNAGFIYMRNTSSVALIWLKVAVEFQRQLDITPPDKMRHMTHDQAILRDFLNSNPPVATVSILDTNQYISGQALDDPTKTKIIAGARVVLLNYAIGVEAKRVRALRHNLWFYNETVGQCLKII